jgi:hypothetical protein
MIAQRKTSNEVALSVALLGVAAAIQAASFISPYFGIGAGLLLALYCVFRCHFLCLPALIVLYCRSSSLLPCILVMATLTVVIAVVQRRLLLPCRFPDILIVPLFLLVGSMTIAACNRSGYYWNQPYLYEMWAVLGLVAFYYGLLLQRTYSPQLMKVTLVAGLIVFLVEFGIRQDEDSKSVVRQIFYWGPFYAGLLVYSIRRLDLTNILFGAVGSILFVTAMIMGLPTLTLQGCAVYAIGFSVIAPYRAALWRVVGYVLSAWPAFLIVVAAMVYGVSNIERQSVARDRGHGEKHEYRFFSFDEDFTERFRAKMFDDRALLWRAVWADANTPPYFWRSTDERLIRDFETALGEYYDFWEIPPHNVYLNALMRMRWPGGVLFLALYCLMILRAGKLLFHRDARGVWLVISGTTVAVGVFGGLTGDFPMLHTFNFPLMVLAGLSYAQYNKCCNDTRRRELGVNLPQVRNGGYVR